MNLLSLCDPASYSSPLSDIPLFYQQLAQDPRVSLHHASLPQVFAAQPPNLEMVPVVGKLDHSQFLALAQIDPTSTDLSAIDVVFCRTLKPFPTGYLDQLAAWEPFVRFVNRPSSKKVQMKPEFLLEVAKDYMPATIVTADWQVAIAFFEQHQTIVAKRANSCGGRGVFKIWYQESAFQVDHVSIGTQTFQTFAEVMAYLLTDQTEPIQFCRYLQRTDAGDKRVVVVAGEIYGSYLRRSRSGHWVNNVSNDGVCTLADITATEWEAIQNTVGRYQALELHTLGYDFLLDDDQTWYISEINAGNVGGFARLELLTGQPVMDRLVGWLLDYAQQT